ncbi:DUF1707 domain-containing protein [Pseudonocardia sp. RS11V-5]|uniref:DUF1707 domain-containing protein n=1 Tax=Pseudonocardia terrae TaxID=2905831 RepID=UPI001E4682A9|nr:DUF1707 domain-containing protein [Pseudonocardia terrae]MCE3556021.1 DUF1707 domain-containing protein [Pseudonocardia terrae]
MSEPEPRPEPTVRIGNAEREEAAQALAEHFSQGRLDGGEYEERVAQVWAARTLEDLGGLFTDLPAPHPAALWNRPGGQSGHTGYGQAYGPPAGLPSGYPGGPYAGPQAPQPFTGYGSVPHSPGHSPAPYGTPTYGAPGLPHHAQGGTLDAPYGREPGTGVPYSDKSKLAAGLLQLFLGGAGIGRFYTGHTGIAIAQLIVTIVTFGLGAVWGFVDGIVLLAGRSTDAQGRPLHP